ncbi:MAG: RluA family pseudouridine synthase, partial [Bacteroidota bacterium]
HSPLSGRSLRKYFFKGLVFCNGKKAHSQTILKFGDHIIVYALSEKNTSLEPEPIPINIIFEDQNLLVINKPASQAVHPSGNIKSRTLSNAVAYYFAQLGIKAKVRPVNRLDYGTSGLIVFAKSAQAQTLLSEEIRKGRIGRIYYAIVNGVVKNDQGVIDLAIGERNGVRTVTPAGKNSLTEYQTLKRFNNASLLEIKLQTGRTHQIRIHLSAIGHPIYGDSQYGVKTVLIKRPALHAGKLVFQNSTFKVPQLQAVWPEDFQNLLNFLEESTQTSNSPSKVKV